MPEYQYVGDFFVGFVNISKVEQMSQMGKMPKPGRIFRIQYNSDSHLLDGQTEHQPSA